DSATHDDRRRVPLALDLQGAAGRPARQAPQPQPVEQEEQNRHSRQDHEGLRGGMYRCTARRLIEEDLNVPTQRQERAPAARERLHRDYREANPGIAEGGRAENAREAEAERQLADEELE